MPIPATRRLPCRPPVVKPLVNIAPNMRLANAVNTWDLRDAAKQRTHLMCFDYLDSGADDEIAINRSRSAYADYECHYRVLAGNSPETLDLRTKIFGRDVNMPFFMWCVWASPGARFPFDGFSILFFFGVAHNVMHLTWRY